MHSTSPARSQIAGATSFVVGPLIWVLVSLFTDKQETWDSGTYYVASLIASFVIAFATYRWMEVVGSWAFGQMLWFASLERAVIDGHLAKAVAALLATSLTPLVGSLAGYAMRRIVELIKTKRGA